MLGRQNLKHPLLSVSLVVHCIASPTLNCVATSLRIRYPPASQVSTLLVLPHRQWRPPPAHAPCTPEQQAERQGKATSHTLLRTHTHMCLPPNRIAKAPKLNTTNKLQRNFLQHTTCSTHPNPERKSQIANQTKHANFNVRNLNLRLKPYTYGHVNRPILNEDSPFQCGIPCNLS